MSRFSWRRRDSDDVSEVEGDHVQLKIAQAQEEHLLPLKEDVAEWVAKTLELWDVTADNLMTRLDTGVLLCRLARLIHQKAEDCKRAGLVKEVPPMRFRCWENAKPESFYARDNTENFLRWCRKFGVHEAVLFESDGLVLHTQTRTVVLCLLELGRIASRFGVEPPGLVKLEKEIEEEYGSDTCSTCSSPLLTPRATSGATTPVSTSERGGGSSLPSARSSPGATTTTPNTRKTQSARPASNRRASQPPPPPSELDLKVMQIVDTVCDDSSHVKRISEGRYHIAGKTVYIRLLKGRHVMVRVGGGWDTLDHYLSRHQEPQRVSRVDRRTSLVEDLASLQQCRNGTSPPPVADTSFLHIRSRYRPTSCTSNRKSR